MSQYNKTVLTNAGLELAKRANAGQAKFEITRAVTSADDWSNKTVQDLEAVTAIPNIMQQGTVMDTEEVESNNSVIGVSLCFANKDLSTGYQIRIIGLYVREEGQENDFLYAVTTAVTPEYMPDFSDGVLYRFNMQMYLVIGKAQAVNVVINDGASVTHGQLDKYKSEVTANLKKIENTHKEDMSHVVKSANINGGDEILPNETGKLELVVPDPDLSKYVSLEQLTEALKTKADVTAIPDKTATEEGIKQAKELAQEADTKAQNALDNKADKTDVNAKIKAVTDLANTKANASDVYTKKAVDDAFSTRDSNITNAANLAKQASQNIDSTLVNSYFRKQGMDTNGNLVEIKSTGVKVNSGGYAFDIWNSDWTASKLKEIINQVASLNSSWQVRSYSDAVNLNDLWTAWGISYLTNSNNTNTPSFISDKRGTLFTFSFDGNGKWQLFAGCIGGLAYRSYLKDDGAWHKFADDTDILDLQSKITNAQNTATQANNNANTRLPLTGGAMNSNAEISFNNDAVGKQGGLTWNGSTDSAKIYGDVTANDNLDLAFDLGDDGSNHFSFRQNGSETSAITSDGHFTGTVDWSRVNGRPEVTPVINGSTGDDLFAYKTNQLRLYPGNGLNCKNLPPAINTQWFTVQYVFEAPNSDGIAIFRSPGTEVWINGNNGGSYGTWKRLADSGDITDLRNQIQQLRDNQFEVQTFTDATAAANWEAQRPGKRMAIVNK